MNNGTAKRGTGRGRGKPLCATDLVILEDAVLKWDSWGKVH